MNYISFDIGIKNMAYCIFSIQDNQFLIRDWNVINLCNDDPICENINKNKKCEKKARFTKENK